MIEYNDIIDISRPQTITGDVLATELLAPLCAVEGGVCIDAILLHHVVGPCRVIDMTDAKEDITSDLLALESIHPGERILLKTRQQTNGAQVTLSTEAAAYLATKGPLLVGLDTTVSVVKKAETHQLFTPLFLRDIPVVAGLDLTGVEPGVYSLAALPVHIVGAERAPVRAVLLY